MIFNAILEKAPIPAVRLNPEIPPRLEEVISKAIEKDRRMRYQHAAELRTDLARLKRDTGSSRISAAVVSAQNSGMATDAAMRAAPSSSPAVATATPMSGTSAATAATALCRGQVRGVAGHVRRDEGERFGKEPRSDLRGSLRC